MWWTSAPQQPSPFGSTTSMPRRVSRRIVASLMPGSSTGWAQPVSMATRPRALALGGDGCRAVDIGDAAGTAARRQRQHRRQRLRAPAARSNRPAKGWPSRASLQRQRGSGRDRAARRPARARMQPVGQRRAGRSPRYGRGHGRRGACSSRPTGRSSCRTRQDRQRSICVTTSRVGRPAVLQHVLDQVDAPARADRARRRAVT